MHIHVHLFYSYFWLVFLTTLFYVQISALYSYPICGNALCICGCISFCENMDCWDKNASWRKGLVTGKTGSNVGQIFISPSFTVGPMYGHASLLNPFFIESRKRTSPYQIKFVRMCGNIQHMASGHPFRLYFTR